MDPVYTKIDENTLQVQSATIATISKSDVQSQLDILKQQRVDYQSKTDQDLANFDQAISDQQALLDKFN